MMRYLLAIYLDEVETAKRSEAEVSADMASHLPYIERLKRNGQLASCDPLSESSAARTLIGADGKVVATAGPFAESREQFGGYYLIDARDLDEALNLAAECPALRTPGVSGIEIRPVLRAGSSAAAADAGADRFFVAVYVDRDGSLSPRPHAHELAPASSATTLRRCNDDVAIFDGPFVDGERELRGYWILSAKDAAQAASLAEPHVGGDVLEIRPIRAGGT
jgi:hypothetical protein